MIDDDRPVTRRRVGRRVAWSIVAFFAVVVVVALVLIGTNDVLANRPMNTRFSDLNHDFLTVIIGRNGLIGQLRHRVTGTICTIGTITEPNDGVRRAIGITACFAGGGAGVVFHQTQYTRLTVGGFDPIGLSVYGQCSE